LFFHFLCGINNNRKEGDINGIFKNKVTATVTFFVAQGFWISTQKEILL
jgi:hypothetical protein